MKVYLATDHAGFEVKEELREYLVSRDVEVIDCGAYEYDPSDDYPDFIAEAARAVSNDPENSRAIIFGGSGQGEAIVANKFPSVRAVVFYGGEGDIVTLSREHNDANVLSFGARFTTPEEVKRLVDVWLAEPFTEEERHVRRINRIKEIETEIKNG